jgi:pantoate--beta-alanine ligase
VATVVSKLFNMVQPDVAFFGQKDAQQALLIRRLVRDLDMPVRVEVCPTVREGDGLAMSSRNVLLAPADRERAPALYRALVAVERAVAAGTHDPGAALAAGARLLTEAGVAPEYFAAVSTDTLAPVRRITGETLVAVAARFGAVRLIDNVLVRPTERGT